MKAIGIIPARLKSTRFPQKILANICNRPLVWHVWNRSKKARLLDEVIIACDERLVVDRASKFGARAVLTSKRHRSGTDRIAEVAKKLKADVIVNIQADEPLVHPSIIDNLVKVFKAHPNTDMATAKKRITKEEDLYSPNIVKIVTDNLDNALYFSRSIIPYPREGCKNILEKRYYKHLGIYAYKRNFLLKFVKLPKSQLEDIEMLEQLRALENGFSIKVIETTHDTIAVDEPKDLKEVEAIMRNSYGKS